MSTVPIESDVLEINKQLVLAYVDAFNRGDLDGACALFAQGALVYGVLGWGTLEQVRPVWHDLMECFRINVHVESIIAERDIVAARFTERGTSLKAFRGGPAPTGRSYEVTAMEWFVVKHNQIHRRWGARDSASIMRQLGLPLQ